MTISVTAQRTDRAGARADLDAHWAALANADVHAGTHAQAPDHFGQAWLAVQCAMIPHALCAVVVLGDPDTGPFIPQAFWPEGASATPLLADVADQALGARAALALPGDDTAAVAFPILVEQHLHGLVAVELGTLDAAALQQAMRQLQWGVQGMQAHLYRAQAQQEQATRERLMTTLDVVASTMTELHFKAAANALVTDLATRLDCDRVSIGFRRGLQTQVIAVSHSAQFASRMNLVRAMAAAMDEAIDQKSVVQLPAAAAGVLVTRDHAALAREHGTDAILTIPFAIDESTAGAFCFERPSSRPFDDTELAQCDAIVALCSRILEEKRRNDRPLALRIKDHVRDELMKLTGPRHFGRKLAAAGAIIAVAFFSVASGSYSVGTNATLEGAVRRVLVSPFDGYLDTAPHRAGDVVKAGTVLATLDQRELQLEYLRWASQSEQYAEQYQEARAKADRVAANVTLAQMQQAKAQMDLLAEHLSRASVAAPFDGIVVHGDLSQSLGSAVKRGQTLFEVAPLNAYRVVLEVPEGEIAHVKEGQTGRLMLASLPGEEFPIVVRQVTPVTVSHDGRSFFRVEASVERMSARMRPGMEGVGKVDVGSRKLFWQWTHQLSDWLRLTLWTWI